MRHRRRRPRGGVRGAAALLVLGTALLGAGGGLALGDGPRLVSEDLGSVPAARAGAEPGDPAAGAGDRTGPGRVTAADPVLPEGAARAARPLLPDVLELPARGITAPVEPVGTGTDGGMVIPEEIDTVGWWAPGVLPGGRAGSAVLAGHVDSAGQGLGVLAVLPELTTGEPVVVRDSYGRAVTYRVTARREYGKYELPGEVFRRDGPPQLVLITCGGVFDPVAGSYESNIVVYAVPGAAG
ncbi:class F sortase [Pseudonocardia nematodicida]|uniref:Class F sortase n=1 Tax=Pseudonocardia nematodicida TaxID=1206997 RepID=A0ABV1KC81_9PSEU